MPYQPAVLGSARLNNFRLNYLTADQAATRPARIWFILGGVDISAPTSPTRVIYKSVSIRDVVFETPNTCQITFYGAAPTLGARLEVWVDSNDPTLLFGGELQTVDRTYKGRPTTVLHPCTAIDDTARANRKRPLGLWTNTSATTIAQWLISTYASGYSSAGVELGLPPVSINFDGSEGGMKGCLTALAKIIGGYWYFEDRTLYLFITPPGPAPDPIDDTPKRFLHDPPIRHTVDKSQVRTRVYGKGASTQLAATVDPTVTIVPVDEATMFNPAGGKAISAITPDGAASRVLTYTGVQSGGGGGLVGPGAAPSSAPGLGLVAGAGIQTGTHAYVVTFVTASGESLPGPSAAIAVGAIASPSTAPTPGAPSAGGAVDVGTWYYGITFVNPAGETTLTTASAPVNTSMGGYYVPAPTSGVSATTNTAGLYTNAWAVGDSLTYRLAYQNAAGLTTLSPVSAGVTGVAMPGFPGNCRAIDLYNIPVSSDPSVTLKRIWRYKNGVVQGSFGVNPAHLGFSGDSGPLSATPAAPVSNTAFVPGTNYQTVPLTGIPIGPAGVTARKLYRSPGGPGWKLVDTIANNTTTTYTDTKATAALGADDPESNTATANQVQVTIPIGGSGVTGRKVYRRWIETDPDYWLQSTIAENTTTSFIDATSYDVLGPNPPMVDTSGLKQPEGQVPAGSTTIVVANTSAFSPSGGWAIVGNGEQAIRYSAMTASSLTGIPPTGVGALVASVSYNSTITASPAILGVAGILETILRGSPMHVWVQRDDLAAQAYMLALDGTGDGIYEHIISDERRSEASLMQVCDAELELYSRPLVTVTYATRDTKTKSGKTVAIALTTPAMTASLTIQDVAISEIGIAPTLRPKYTVTASSVRHSFDAILQQLLRKAGA